MSEYKSIEHSSTVITCNNDSELFYVLKWSERSGKHVVSWMYERDKFPFHVSVHSNIVGWTDLDDRALYYMPFSEFIDSLRKSK